MFLHSRKDFVTDDGQSIAEDLLNACAPNSTTLLKRQHVLRGVQDALNHGMTASLVHRARHAYGQCVPQLKTAIAEMDDFRACSGALALNWYYTYLGGVASIVGLPMNCMWLSGEIVASAGREPAVNGLVNAFWGGICEMLSTETISATISLSLVVMLYTINCIKGVRSMHGVWIKQKAEQRQISCLRKCARSVDVMWRILCKGESSDVSAFGIQLALEGNCARRLHRELLRTCCPYSRRLCDVPDISRLLSDTLRIGAFLDAIIGICSSVSAASCWTHFVADQPDCQMMLKSSHTTIISSFCKMSSPRQVSEFAIAARYTMSCGVTPHSDACTSPFFKKIEYIRDYGGKDGDTCVTNTCNIIKRLYAFCTDDTQTLCIVMHDPFQGLGDDYAAAVCDKMAHAFRQHRNVCVCYSARAHCLREIEPEIDASVADLLRGAVKEIRTK
jgi:hypothetical protein